MAADEILIGPADVYVAPVGTAFPVVDEAPGAGWILIGTQGDKNYTEDGVIIRAPKTTELVRALGTTLPRKAAITETGFEVEFTVMDMSPAEMLLALGADPTDFVDTPAGTGVAGIQTFAIPTAPVPLQRAVLVRFASPIDPDLAAQIQIAAAIQTGSAEGAFTKGAPFAMQHIWQAIEPDSGEAVEFVYQDAVAI